MNMAFCSIVASCEFSVVASRYMYCSKRGRGGQGGHMSPGAGLRGRRNRREISTHGQIQGAVVTPFI